MIVEGAVLNLPFDDIDTDQIIAAHHLTVLEPGRLGAFLFEGQPRLLDRLVAAVNPTIVVAGRNFGCGSSREHAVWALKERGIRAVVARSFARIFLESAYNNGVVPVELDDAGLERCARSQTLRIDAEHESLVVDGEAVRFHLDALRKQFLLGGGYLQFLASRIPAIREWERCRA